MAAKLWAGAAGNGSAARKAVAGAGNPRSDWEGLLSFLAAVLWRHKSWPVGDRLLEAHGLLAGVVAASSD